MPRPARRLLTLKGHTGPVNSVAFSPDGKRLVERGLLDKHGGEGVGCADRPGTPHPQGGQRRVRSVAFSPDGHCLASGAADGTVTIWDATPLPEKP